MLFAMTVPGGAGPQSSGRRRRQRGRPRITLDQLHTFVAVAEREHLTKAAEALDLSQGSVSAQIRRLERTLHLPLLHRVGRNVRLTDVGREVHRLALGVLERAQLIEDIADGYLGVERGEVSVAAGPVIGAHRLPGWLAPFVQAHPQIDVHITLAPMEAAVEQLAVGRVDVVVFVTSDAKAGVPDDWETLTLETTELVVVVSARHPLANSVDVARELARYRHLHHGPGSATERLARRLLEGQDEPAGLAVELEEGALVAALHAGLGFAVMPRAIVEPDIVSGRLTVLPHPGSRVPAVFTALRRAGPHTPAVSLLWGYLSKVAKAQEPTTPEGAGAG